MRDEIILPGVDFAKSQFNRQTVVLRSSLKAELDQNLKFTVADKHIHSDAVYINTCRKFSMLEHDADLGGLQ
jgi:hypothetical protein